MIGDKLEDYPCPFLCAGPCTSYPGPGCPPGHDESCKVLPVYRAHIALRCAVLGDMTPAEAAFAYRSVAPEAWNHPFLRNDQHFKILADVVAEMEWPQRFQEEENES